MVGGDERLVSREDVLGSGDKLFVDFPQESLIGRGQPVLTLPMRAGGLLTSGFVCRAAESASLATKSVSMLSCTASRLGQQAADVGIELSKDVSARYIKGSGDQP